MTFHGAHVWYYFFQHSVLDEPIAEAVGIVADTDKWYGIGAIL